MKSSVCFLLSACLAGLLFSCAANPTPKWVTKLPQPPKNCGYQRGEGTAETRDKARKKAEEDALDKTLINGMNIRKTSGVNHKFICEHIIEENAFKYNAHALLIYQTDFREKCDLNEGLRNCESKPVPVNPNGENSAEAGKKIGELSQKTDSLGALAQKFEWTNNPKEKNEIWHEGSKLHREIKELQTELQALGAGTNVDSIASVFEKMQKSCIEYRKNMKIHWNPEKENEYSSMAFSVLSKNLKLEKSACQGNGVLLAYKHAEPDCPYKFGLFNCSYKPSLSILSCDGTEYSALEDAVENSHQKQDLALDIMKDIFRAADFWKKWEAEIKEWSLKCE